MIGLTLPSPAGSTLLDVTMHPTALLAEAARVRSHRNLQGIYHPIWQYQTQEEDSVIKTKLWPAKSIPDFAANLNFPSLILRLFSSHVRHSPPAKISQKSLWPAKQYPKSCSRFELPFS